MLLIGLIFTIIFLDQWSKWIIRSSFKLYESKPIIENFVHLTYVTNDGMAFGLSFPGGKNLLLIMTIFLTAFILWLLWKEKESHYLIKYGLALIFSGAIGNLTDRMFFGKVVDFMDIMIGDFHWYIFNVADSSVTIGMIMFIFHSIFVEHNSKKIKIVND